MITTLYSPTCCVISIGINGRSDGSDRPSSATFFSRVTLYIPVRQIAVRLTNTQECPAQRAVGAELCSVIEYAMGLCVTQWNCFYFFVLVANPEYVFLAGRTEESHGGKHAMTCHVCVTGLHDDTIAHHHEPGAPRFLKLSLHVQYRHRTTSSGRRSSGTPLVGGVLRTLLSITLGQIKAQNEHTLRNELTTNVTRIDAPLLACC